MSVEDVVACNVRVEMAKRKSMQRDVALVIGLSQPQLSKRLRGLLPFSVRELALLARFFDVPVETLTAGAGDAVESLATVAAS